MANSLMRSNRICCCSKTMPSSTVPKGGGQARDETTKPAIKYSKSLASLALYSLDHLVIIVRMLLLAKPRRERRDGPDAYPGFVQPVSISRKSPPSSPDQRRSFVICRHVGSRAVVTAVFRPSRSRAHRSPIPCRSTTYVSSSNRHTLGTVYAIYRL